MMSARLVIVASQLGAEIRQIEQELTVGNYFEMIGILERKRAEFKMINAKINSYETCMGFPGAGK